MKTPKRKLARSTKTLLNQSVPCTSFWVQHYGKALLARNELIGRIGDKTGLPILSSERWYKAPRTVVSEIEKFVTLEANDERRRLAKEIAMGLALYEVARHCESDEFILWRNPLVAREFLLDLSAGAGSRAGSELGAQNATEHKTG